MYDTPKHKKSHFAPKALEADVEELKLLYKYFGVQWMVSEVDSILKWEDKFKSSISIFLFIGFVYIFEPWMIPCFLLLIFSKNYFDLHVKSDSYRKFHLEATDSNSNLSRNVINGSSIDDKDTLNVEEKKDKKSIRSIIRKIINISQEVQRLLAKIVRFGQRLQNILEFKVPFLSSITLALLLFLTIIFWLIPLRYLIMMAGVKHILRGLISPNSTSFIQRLRIFVSKIPDNDELEKYVSPKDTWFDVDNLLSEIDLPAIEMINGSQCQSQKTSDSNKSQPTGIEQGLAQPAQKRTRKLLALDYTKGYVPIFKHSMSLSEETSKSKMIEEALKTESLCDSINYEPPKIVISSYEDTEPSDTCDRKYLSHDKIRKSISKSLTNLSVYEGGQSTTPRQSCHGWERPEFLPHCHIVNEYGLDVHKY